MNLPALPVPRVFGTAIAACALLAAANDMPLHAQGLAHASAPVATSIPPVVGPRADALDGFILRLWPEARAQGVSRPVFDQAMRGLTPDADIIALLDNQPEHSKTAAEYLAQVVSQARVETGQRKASELAPVLERIERAYGVDRDIVLAVWGIETSFGASTGSRSVIRSLATLAVADPRRPQYWRKELLTALVILQRGDITPDRMTGSWAGAMGHTQFMPSSFMAHAVDFDGDGRRNIWTSIPDALASTANYLKHAGWAAGEAWGYEAVPPDNFDFASATPAGARTLFDWLAIGMSPPAGRKFLPARGSLQVMLPAGARGPAFLVTRNFRALLRYNNSVSYALAVGHLADRIAGDAPLATPWPSDRALSRSEREELQQLLLSKGHDIGTVDGRIGSQTRDAIREFQRTRGLPEDGHAGPRLLEDLRRTNASSSRIVSD
jgi:membrane-bound lytic murein transglycosylase B